MKNIKRQKEIANQLLPEGMECIEFAGFLMIQSNYKGKDGFLLCVALPKELKDNEIPEYTEAAIKEINCAIYDHENEIVNTYKGGKGE